jgi:hypothetical protein
MSRRLILAVSSALALFAATPRISRADLRPLEQGFDQRINQAAVDDPLDLLGNTRAIYLGNVGVIFSTEVGLVVSPAITPFTPAPTPEVRERLRQRKIARLPMLRKIMRDMMIASALGLKSMPMEEQIVMGVSLFYRPWEDITGLPVQIVMQASRRTLADIEAGRIKPEASGAAIQEQVY